MLRTGEEAGRCAWVLSHTILCMNVYMCIFHTVLSVYVYVYGHSRVCVCVLSLRQSFDPSPPEQWSRQMPSPPGSYLIPGCGLCRLTARCL